MTSLPEDYLHRVYAGILGKLIGVYLGRPFENWTYQQILQKLGPIHYFVHEKFNLPCVVIDDDVSGTFAFFRALEEHGFSEDLSSEEVGKTWLNNIIEQKCVFWWGGNGISTEQTAFLNLKRGIKAPLSGSSKTNGRTVAEQIGSQIFIDAWAMLAPGKPALAANLARAAAMVSHDGEAVYAAQLWAAMEAEAFLSKDADHLLDTGLCFIPKDSEIASMISQIRRWVVEDGDWHLTRQRIEDVYGYDKYDGICHIMPNHGIMIMALLYAGDDFTRALHIINTSGWDTDCNSGNVGCLVAIMLGMAAFDGEPDWRGPIADRALISSADGGYSINDAARIAYDIVDIGYRLAGEAAIARPEAQFHFTLPGSVQGFTATGLGVLHVHQGVEDGRTGLCARIKGWMPGDSPIYISTPLFTPPEVLTVSRHYQMMACPLLYPGQRVRAQVSIRDWRSEFVPSVCLRIKAYDEHDHLITLESQPIELGHEDELAWTIPNCLDNKPIQQIGIAISGEGCLEGSVWLHNLRWEGMPRTTLQRPSAGPEELQGVEHVGNNSFWERSWVSSVDKFHSSMGPSFYLAQDRGEGMITQGTRDWRDYEAIAHGFVLNLGAPAGLAIRVRGLNRWYAVMFVRGESDEKNFVVLMKARDEQRIHLMSRPFQWKLDSRYEVRLRADGSRLTACVGDVVLEATDAEYQGGGVGLVLTAGSLSVERITIT